MQNTTTGPVEFAKWLNRRIADDGRTNRAVRAAAGIGSTTLHRALNEPEKPVSEPIVRALARALGDDEDAIAELAGFSKLSRPPVPEPGPSQPFPQWLKEVAMALWGENPRSLSLAMGLSSETAYRWLSADKPSIPNRPTMDLIADHYGIPRATLRAFVVTYDSRVAVGRENFQRFDTDTQTRMLANLTGQTTEHRREIGRLGGSVSAAKGKRTRPPTYLSDLLAQARLRRLEVNAERGSRFKSQETQQQFVERWRASGAGERAWATNLERYGLDFFLEKLKAAAAPDAEWVLCKACEHRVGWRPPATPARGRYHLECYLAYLRTAEAVERLHGFQAIAWMLGLDGVRAIEWMLKRVAASGDTALEQDVQQRAAVQRDDLQREAMGNPRRRGRPSTLVTDKNLSINASILHDDLGLSAGEIAELADRRHYRSQSGYTSANRWAEEQIRLGRALRGLSSQPV